MVQWKSFGVSAIGPGHIRKGMPNQDFFAERHLESFDCVVASDGVGSCPKSDIGSAMACHAVIETASKFSSYQPKPDIKEIIECVKSRFLENIKPFTPRDCSATCLFALRWEENVLMALLGDGMVAAIQNNGDVIILGDDKSSSFSNLVSALSPKAQFTDWKTLQMRENDCMGIVLCTDGISDDLEDPKGFAKGFWESCQKVSLETNIENTREMLLNWSVPRHSDDKTIVCMYRSEVQDE